MFRKRSGGFSLISAIFLLVVVTLLGAYVATLSTNQHIAEALDVEGARAYQAARAGVDWGAWQILQAPAGGFRTSCDGATYATPFSQPLAGLPGTLSGFAVQVQCGSAATDRGRREHPDLSPYGDRIERQPRKPVLRGTTIAGYLGKRQLKLGSHATSVCRFSLLRDQRTCRGCMPSSDDWNE